MIPHCDYATLLVSAILGNVKHIENILFVLRHLRRPMQVGWHNRNVESDMFYPKNFANVNEPKRILDTCHVGFVWALWAGGYVGM
jgi:hypothetical protein